MKKSPLKLKWYYGAFLMLVLMITPILYFWPRSTETNKKDPRDFVQKVHVHLDHTGFFPDPISKAQDVTKSCLECHPSTAKEVMKTSHYTWERGPVKLPRRKEKLKIGKRNLINNFCIGIQGNEASCASCHSGYGWENNSPISQNEHDVDCLICHDGSGSYAKGNQGYPLESVNLQLVAQSVSYPKRENCGKCHIYGGGGMGVKHGDLDNSLLNPSEVIDAHMSKASMECIDCHKTEHHQIKGQAYSVSVSANENALECSDCHDNAPHRSERLNEHIFSLACQTCHIPSFARKVPTKMYWDWSKAGNNKRKEDHLTYLKIKGEFIYEKNVLPKYAWFNKTVDRYILGDKINPKKITEINRPLGDIFDAKAKIWPFKVHEAMQPFDRVHKYLMAPTTSGEGGYWHDFNWDKALRLSEKSTGLPYSGVYGFTKTRMHWSLSHMIPPKEKSLQCADCHGENATRLNWKKLEYSGDPISNGGRKSQELIKTQGSIYENK